jgi:proline iminopeptidase
MIKWILKLSVIPLALGLLFLLLMGNPQPEFEPESLRQFRLTVTGEYLGQVGHGLWHPHLLVSGANKAEATLPLPGDKLVPEAVMQLTRVITIDASTRDIWPWLLQMGYERGGWYAWQPLSGDIEFGTKIASAKKIRPDLQQLKIGDILLDGPGSDKKRRAWTVKMYYQDRALVLYSARETKTGREFDPKGSKPAAGYIICSWAFVLEPINKNSTRLILRTRTAPGPDPSIGFGHYFLMLGDTAMQRSMLDGIKKRVEQVNKDKMIPLDMDQE